jgi:hypothetical protein
MATVRKKHEQNSLTHAYGCGFSWKHWGRECRFMALVPACMAVLATGMLKIPGAKLSGAVVNERDEVQCREAKMGAIAPADTGIRPHP